MTIKRIKLFLIFLLFPLFSISQFENGPGNGNGDPCDRPNPPPWCNKGCWPPPCVPTGTTIGIICLTGAGFCIAYKKLGHE